MGKPVYQIETWTVAVKDHTITSDAISVYSKEIVTDGVGHFNFVVPTKKNGDYYYDDIALNDKVKIWYGYDSVSGNPDFIGKVGAISAPLSTASGYVRQISGLSQGEILLRRFKKNKFYTGTNASVIVTEWANDLSLGTGDITADTNQPDIEVRTKSYFELLRFISDYWIDGANQIKKDFYVDIDNDLVWKTRPFRSGSSVETFTVGKNIIHYNVTQKVEQVKNDIVVYGEATKPLPSNKDNYTEPASSPPPGWSASSGTVDRDNTAPQVGTYSVRGDDNGTQTSTFKYDLPRITIRDINRLLFWHRINVAAPVTKVVRLHAPDNANYFEATMVGGVGAYAFDDLSLGPGAVYHATENPNGTWIVTGSPNWWDIEFIEFSVVWPNPNRTVDIDGLWFYPDRWSGTATDAGSITSYGQRDLEITDDKLHSDSECQQRAETVLFQRKDHPTQIDLTVLGNTNVLIGDRLSMTIPAEGISAVNFDVISVEHSFSSQGFITKAVMVNSANIREPIASTPLRSLIKARRRLSELATDEKGIR